MNLNRDVIDAFEIVLHYEISIEEIHNTENRRPVLARAFEIFWQRYFESVCRYSVERGNLSSGFAFPGYSADAYFSSSIAGDFSKFIYPPAEASFLPLDDEALNRRKIFEENMLLARAFPISSNFAEGFENVDQMEQALGVFLRSLPLTGRI